MSSSTRVLAWQLLFVIGIAQAIALTAGVAAGSAGIPNMVAALACGSASLMVGIVVVIRRASARANAVAQMADRLSRGEFDARLDIHESSDLGDVAAALNRMAASLGTRMDDVEAARQEQQAILQSMSNGVIALDAEQRILRMNRAAEASLNLIESQVQGRLLHEVLRQPELHRLAGNAVDGLAAGPTEVRIEALTPVTLLAVAEPLRRPDGSAEGVLIVLNDVTQLRRLESLRSDFAANVSHELRTPITNIRGYAETLLDVGWDDQAQAESFLHIIRKNSVRLAAIIEDVLSLAQFEQPASHESLECEPVPLRTVVSSAVAQVEMAASEKGMTIETSIDPALTARMQPQLIEQAVANLLSNAIAYSPAKTVVAVRGWSVESTLMIAVTDQGPGIAPEHLERIFERFYRADKARSRDLGGTGLGLAIVKHIALIHGGWPEVESSVGRGSTFRLVLPDAVAQRHALPA